MSIDRDPTYAKVATLACSILLALCLAMASIAEGQVPKSEWTQEAKHSLSRALVGEAEVLPTRDWSMISGVLARRWELVHPRQGWSFAELIRRYTMLKNKGKRAARIRALPWGPLSVPEGDLRAAARSERWLRVIDWVHRWGEGWIADTCPEADHWAGKNPTAQALRNIEKAGWRYLPDCGTHNRPYAEVSR